MDLNQIQESGKTLIKIKSNNLPDDVLIFDGTNEEFLTLITGLGVNAVYYWSLSIHDVIRSIFEANDAKFDYSEKELLEGFKSLEHTLLRTDSVKYGKAIDQIRLIRATTDFKCAAIFQLYASIEGRLITSNIYEPEWIVKYKELFTTFKGVMTLGE